MAERIYDVNKKAYVQRGAGKPTAEDIWAIVSKKFNIHISSDGTVSWDDSQLTAQENTDLETYLANL